jgi:hypothetical protein
MQNERRHYVPRGLEKTTWSHFAQVRNATRLESVCSKICYDMQMSLMCSLVRFTTEMGISQLRQSQGSSRPCRRHAHTPAITRKNFCRKVFPSLQDHRGMLFRHNSTKSRRLTILSRVSQQGPSQQGIAPVDIS